MNITPKSIFWPLQTVAIFFVVVFDAISFIQPESGTPLNRLGWDLVVPFILGTVVLVTGGVAVLISALKKPAKTRVRLIALGIGLILLATWWLIISSLPGASFWFSHYGLSE